MRTKVSVLHTLPDAVNIRCTVFSATADLLVCLGELECRVQETQAALRIADAKVAELFISVDDVAEPGKQQEAFDAFIRKFTAELLKTKARLVTMTDKKMALS